MLTRFLRRGRGGASRAFSAAAAAAVVPTQARPRLVLDKSVVKVAPAVFQLAHQANLVSEVEAKLKDWVKALETSDAVKRLFVIPGITNDRRAAKITEAFARRIAARKGQDPKADQVDQITAKALSAMAQKGQLSHLPKLATAFTLVRKDFNKEVDCTVVTATEIPRQKVLSILSGVKKYIAPDEKLVVKTQVDPKVMGGFVARFGWNELDFSVASMVEAGRKKLASISLQQLINPTTGEQAVAQTTDRSPNVFRTSNGTVITIVKGRPVVKLPPGAVFKKREKGVKVPVPPLPTRKAA